MSGDWRAQLRILRHHHGLKQAVLAEMLNVDQATVSRWENGRQEPDLVGKKRLSDLLLQYGRRAEADIRALMASPLSCRLLLTGHLEIVEASAEAFRRLNVDSTLLVGRNLRDILDDPTYGNLLDRNADAIRRGDFAHMLSRFRLPLLGWVETYSVAVLYCGQVHLLSECRPVPDSGRDQPALELSPRP